MEKQQYGDNQIQQASGESSLKLIQIAVVLKVGKVMQIFFFCFNTCKNASSTNFGGPKNPQKFKLNVRDRNFW